MFKSIFFVLFFMFTLNLQALDSCLEKVKADQLKQMGSDFVGLYPVAQDEVKFYIEGSFDENEDALDKMTKLIGKKNIEFYLILWSVPGNSGQNLISVDAKSCKETASILYTSEEG